VRVAALSDIHGNLPALEAVLREVEREGVDAIVVSGDSISGPWPVDVFDRLDELGALIVRGNADRHVLDTERGTEDPETALARWCADALGPERLVAAAGWPVTREVDVGGLGQVLVCHSTPSSDEVIYTRITPDDEVAGLLAGVAADVVVSGHTHIQFDRRLTSGLRVVNPGSVGMPYEGTRGAFWAILGPDVEHRRTEYDVDAAVRAIRSLGAPVREELLSLLVEPMASDEATAEFEKLRGA
jgi:putative phosphoesterase